jgi:hypothetical protein
MVSLEDNLDRYRRVVFVNSSYGRHDRILDIFLIEANRFILLDVIER